jgi:hypothetical protein
MKYDVIETKRIWKIVDKRNDYKLIFLKWIFIYKFDFDNFFYKYKTHIEIRDDLQKINNVQNVYVATFASKIFRMMMTFVVNFVFQNQIIKRCKCFFKCFQWWKDILSNIE